MRGKILDYTTQIESLLTKLGATGRGMHEKLDSIESKIELSMVKKIRWIATTNQYVASPTAQTHGSAARCLVLCAPLHLLAMRHG